MMYRRLSISLMLIVIALCVTAQNNSGTNKSLFKYRGFSGGMMLHTGYLRSDCFSLYDFAHANLGELQIEGMPFGLGGALRFNFGTEYHQLRVGGEGYTSTIKYSPNDSYEKIGWGGLLLDYYYHGSSRVRPFVGATFGGGGVKNHTYLEEVNSDYEIEAHSSFRKYSFFCMSPFVGIEIAVSKKMLLVLKADYLMNVSNRQSDFADGLRLYVGVIFNHSH